MNKSDLFIKKMLPVALALGTAWAARGQIGHEYGAAWAGSIGVLTVICLADRNDWYNRLPVIVSLGAIAWGTGGIISYGRVVGFGHAADYINTSYGLVMLLFIGGLYGFLGGGITGLALESTPEKKIDWAALFTQMLAGGYLSWGLFIFELEWFMTPPRSELWAACLGASLALGWFLFRNGYTHALRTAFFSALGAGFGFGFGNFLQRMGQGTGINFNWWNVMEYSIGFFGGLGMSYGIFSSNQWPETIKPERISNRAGWVFLLLLLPVINLIEGVSTGTMMATGERLQVADPAAFALSWQVITWILSLLFILFLVFYMGLYRQPDITRQRAIIFTVLYLSWYVLISNLISATWLSAVFSSQHLYWLNLFVLFFMLRSRAAGSFATIYNTPVTHKFALLKWWVVALLVILLLSYVAIVTGTANSKAQLRF